MTKKILFFLLFSLSPLLAIEVTTPQFSPAHYLIIGDAPSFDKELVELLRKGKKIIALDGVADHLSKEEIIPDVILGDFNSIQNTEYWGVKDNFDTLSNDSPSYLGNHGVLIVPAKNQNLTDLEKGILFCDDQKALSITIINVTGGRMDHSIGNIRFLKRYYKPSRQLLLVTDRQTLEYVQNEQVVMQGTPGNHCGIMAFPSATITTSGLSYDVENYTLEFALSESICNSLLGKEALIQVEGEALVIHPEIIDTNE